MNYIYFILVLLTFSCGEDKHTKDAEENTYYSEYMQIYNAYDSIGPAKTIESIDEYLTEFPNAQNAYIFKAWVLANNNQVAKINDVFETALTYNSANVAIYEYWAALLLNDSTHLEKAKSINEEGYKIDSQDIVLDNNLTWILLFENNANEAFSNSLAVLNKDTINNFRYYRTAAVCAISVKKDSLYHYYKNSAIKYGQKDSLELEKFYKRSESVFELYKKLK